MKQGLLLSTVAAMSLGVAPAALAQDVSDGGEDTASNTTVDTIIVTAQRRSEAAQDVPIAISAFSGDSLDELGIIDTRDLGAVVPGLWVNNNTGLGSANSYFLRGLGNAESIATFDPPVGTYIDEVYISRQNANNFNLFDVERVEVLRGPQGTLFGRNTTGGAVSIIMADPEPYVNGYAEIGYGSYNTVEASGSIDIPLTDRLFTKVSAFLNQGDGYAQNTTTGQRANDNDGWGVRLGALFEISPDVEWRGSYSHVVNDSEYLPNFECDPADPTNCDGRFLTTGLILGGTADVTPYPQFDVTGDKALLLGGAHSNTDLFTSNFQIGVGDDATLNLITGYLNLHQTFALDYDDGRGGATMNNLNPVVQGAPLGVFALLNDATSEQFSQEIKLSGSLADGLIDYVTGAFYMKEDSSTDFADLLTLFDTPNVPGSATTPILLADRIMENSTESVAAYVQGDVHVTDQITLTAGIRYTDETKTFAVFDNRAQCQVVPLPANCLSNDRFVSANGVPIPQEMSIGIWTPRFAVNFAPNDDLLVYASATRGFKSAGWNARSSSNANLLPFDPEIIWSYEAGFKAELFDRRARLNVTAFYMEDADLQTPASRIDPVTGALTSFTRNFSDYINRGIEAEFTVVPVAGLNLYVNASYARDKFSIDYDSPATDEYGVRSVWAQLEDCQAELDAGIVPTGSGSCASGIVTADGQIATPQRTPDFTVSFGGNYTIDLGDSGMTVVPSVNAYYRSSLEVHTANISFYDDPVTGSNGTFNNNPFGNGELVGGSHSPSVLLVNARVALNGPDDAWTLALECSNCTDRARTEGLLQNFTYLNPPRSVMLSGRVNF